MFCCELVEAECGCAQSKHGTRDPSAGQRHVTSGKSTQREGRRGHPTTDRRRRPTREKEKGGRIAKGMKIRRNEGITRRSQGNLQMCPVTFVQYRREAETGTVVKRLECVGCVGLHSFRVCMEWRWADVIASGASDRGIQVSQTIINRKNIERHFTM
mmetsp:Transcript_10865/g.36606  ORF Transcript_10865/g.36606 Transcript_10865/m.36606 type:complete len:157 (-) Transcript_10865:88-558(-)